MLHWRGPASQDKGVSCLAADLYGLLQTNATFDPYEYIENGEIVGIDAEFAKALCDKLGYDLHIEDMEFDSIIAAVNSGKADFGMAGMTVTPERQEQIDFTDTYCTAAQSIIVLK